MPINQPANQIKLTNVSVVRLKKGGKRFEVGHSRTSSARMIVGLNAYAFIIFFPDRLLQEQGPGMADGRVAPNEDLLKIFGTTELEPIVLDILKKGELQVGEKERSHELSSTWRDIATQVVEKCIDPRSQRPYTVGMIEKAMAEVHFSVKPGKSAKSQALELIKILQEKKTIPIERARMKVRVTMPNKDGKRIKEKVVPLVEKVEDEDWTDEWELIAMISPGSLRLINELLEEETKGRGRVETLSFATVLDGHDGDERID
ncbi:unnamed protein product [Tilletia controversa]|nr:unnamed protein product [Tilletia controversa]